MLILVAARLASLPVGVSYLTGLHDARETDDDVLLRVIASELRASGGAIHNRRGRPAGRPRSCVFGVGRATGCWR